MRDKRLIKLVMISKNSNFFIAVLCFVLTTSIGCSENEEMLDETPMPSINNAPQAFDLVEVQDNTTNLDISGATFTWEAAIDPDGDSVTYDVYFGTDSTSVDILVETTANLSFNFSDRFNICTKYYWKVIAKDNNGDVTESSSTFTFTTRNINVSTTALIEHASFNERNRHTSVVFEDRLWVIGGGGSRVDQQFSDVYSSADGINWEEITVNAPFGVRQEHATVVFKDKIWVIGGGRILNDNSWQKLYDVWYSDDGWNWFQATSQVPFEMVYHYSTIAFNDKLWVFGGYINNTPTVPNNKIWSSTDGVVWQEHEPPNHNTPLGRGSTRIFKDDIWFLGEYGIVRKSSDGINWQVVTNELETYGDAKWHASTVFDDQIWLVGGHVLQEGGTRSESMNTIWKSRDGIAWNKVETPTEFPVRSLHTALTLNDKIFVIAGQSPYVSNDVWVLD